MCFMKKILVSFGILGLLVLFSLDITHRAIGQEVYKIGITMTFSGSLSGWGMLMFTASQIAVDDQNRKGGIKGHELKLIAEDTKGTAEGGIAAIRKVVEFDKVPAVVTQFTHITLAQCQYVDSKEIVLASTVQAPGMAEKSKWHFVHSIQAKDEARFLLDAAKRLGLKRLFSFDGDNAWGRSMYDLSKKIWVDEKGGIYENAYFKFGETDFRGIIARAQAFNPDVILMIGQGTTEDGLIIKQVREAGIKAQIFMHAADMVPQCVKTFGQAGEGIITSDVQRTGQEFERFAAEFKKRTGEDYWVHIPIQYDLTRMLMQAIDNGGYSAKGMREYLVNLKNFPMLGGGTVSFDANKLAAPTNFALYQIKGGKKVPY